MFGSSSFGSAAFAYEPVVVVIGADPRTLTPIVHSVAPRPTFTTPIARSTMTCAVAARRTITHIWE